MRRSEGSEKPGVAKMKPGWRVGRESAGQAKAAKKPFRPWEKDKQSQVHATAAVKAARIAEKKNS